MYTTMRARVLLFSVAVTLLSQRGVHAQTQAADAGRLAQCDRDLCDIIRAPDAAGRPLRCDLGQTFSKAQINRAIRSKGLAWPLGDTRCTVRLDVPRATIARAMTAEQHTLRLPPHRAECEVEFAGGRFPVTVSLAPRLEFEDGRAETVALGVEKIDANIVIKTVLWSASKLEENLGLFQEEFVRGVNGYIARHCRARPNVRRNARLNDASVR